MNYECISVPYVQQKRETRTRRLPIRAGNKVAASSTSVTRVHITGVPPNPADQRRFGRVQGS
jgi:hypothetical protein